MVSKTVEASSPSNIERSVASALLSLSSCPSVGRRGDDSSSPESLESTGFSALKIGSSPVAAAEEVSVNEESSCAPQLMVAEFVSRSHDLKLKIVRKKRSRSIYITSGKKLKISKPEPESSKTVSEVTTEASSCFSSSSSSNTSATDKPRMPIMSSHIGRKAAAIFRVLSNGSTSEVILRQVLGDNPSTSKALRMLLKLQIVKRFGAGGRSDPYIYTIA